MRRRAAILAATAAWPLIYLYRYVIPGRAFSAGIGNDFLHLYYGYKLYLLAALSQGELPLWSPSEAAGYPFWSSPFAQVCYPLNLILWVVYELAGGYSVWAHQVFTVAGISIFAVGTLLWLRELGVGWRAAACGSWGVAIGFRLTELVRFPNAVHTAAWLPWLLWGLAAVARPERRGRAALAVFGATLCALTAGYPYYVIYAPALLLPYACALWSPHARRAWGLAPLPDGGRAAVVAGAALTAAGLLAAPYVLAQRRLLDQTAGRSGAAGAADAFPFDAWDSLGAWTYPPAASPEGWSYLGALPTLLILAFAVGVALDPARRVRWGRPLALVLAWLALVTWASWGARSTLLAGLQSLAPLLGRLRSWGRLNVVALPALAWLLALAYAQLELRLTRGDRGWPCAARDALLAGALFLTVQLGLHLGGVRDPLWAKWFSALSSPWWFVGAGLLGAATLVALCAAAPDRRPWARAALLALIVVGGARETLPTGGRQWSREPITDLPARIDVRAVTWASLRTPRLLRHGALQLGSSHNAGLVPDWYFRRYREVQDRAFVTEGDLVTRWTVRDPAEAQAFATLLGLRDGRRLFLTRHLDHPSLAAFVADAATCPGTIEPVAYDGDALRVRVTDLEAPAYLTFVDNWAPGWEAHVDGAPTPLLRPFGSFKAVALSPGAHEAEFVYRPF